jgi:hypothetical protein
MVRSTRYFSHDYDASTDQKILALRFAHGAEGYGIFWMLVESMAKDTTGYIDRGAIGGLSVGYGVAISLLESVIETCLKTGLFKTCDHGRIFSERILRHKEEMSKYSNCGKKGAEIRWGNRGANSPPIKGVNAKEIKGKEIKKISATSGDVASPKKESAPAYTPEWEAFWTSYPARNGKRLGKAEAFRFWLSMTAADRAAAAANLPNYAAADTIHRDPIRYLRKGFFREWDTPPVPDTARRPQPQTDISRAMP